MLSSLYARKQREDGFTLIELLIVVIIIGILAAIALPIFIDQQKVAIDASVQSDVRNTVTNVVNAQASGAPSVRLAISRDGTGIEVINSTDEARGGKVVRTDSSVSTLLNTAPKLGDEYKVAGYNPGGKKYQGSEVDGGKAYTFNSTTGSFTSAVAPSAIGTKYTVSSSGYSADFSGTNYSGVNLANGSYATDGASKTFRVQFADATLPKVDFTCAQPATTSSIQSQDFGITNVKLLRADGSEMPELTGTGSLKVELFCPYTVGPDGQDPFARARFVFDAPASARSFDHTTEVAKATFNYNGTGHTITF